ncbi:MAG: hypothetical protein LBT16_06945 [Treponema sp.]|jgi:hypothetical protein|nr:hypothetical protein [Treponema sp.]
MKKMVLAPVLFAVIAVLGFSQARFVYGTGAGRNFQEFAYRSANLEEALLSYTSENFKITAAILYSGYNEQGKFETIIVRDPRWAFNSSAVPLFFMELKGKMDQKYIDIIKDAGYGGLITVLYIRRKTGNSDVSLNSEFVIDAIRFPFTIAQ